MRKGTTTMSLSFTVEDLARILREGAGEDGGLDDSTLDIPFAELGLESLALLEATVLIGQQFGVDLDDSVLTGVATPRELIRIVNEGLAATAVG
jgi:act minimal PKS acyl carrier protein